MIQKKISEASSNLRGDEDEIDLDHVDSPKFAVTSLFNTYT